MRLSRILAVAALATGVALATTQPADAGLTVSFTNTSYKFSGTIPGTAGTYATADFTRIDSDTVQVKFSIPSSAVSGLYLDEAGFQFNATGAAFVYKSGQKSTAAFNASGIAVNGTGNEKFNTNFAFSNKNADRVKFGQDSVYEINFTGVSLANDLSNLLTTPNASGNPYSSAAHIAGYGNSAGIAGVPEPSLMAMGAAGIAGLFGVRRRFGRKAAAA